MEQQYIKSNASENIPKAPPIVLVVIVFSCLILVSILLKVVVSSDTDQPIVDDFLEPEHPPLVIPPEATQGPVWQKINIEKGDTLTGIFLDNKISRDDLSHILQLPESEQYLIALHPGNQMHLELDNNNLLLELRYELNGTQELVLSRNKDVPHGFTTHINTHPLKVKTVEAQGVITSNLFAAGKAADIPDKVIMQLANIFQWQVDFARDLQPGDNFKIIYEQYTKDKQSSHSGHIIAAEIKNKNHTYDAIRFEYPKHHVGYYNPRGQNLSPAFLRTPVKYTRISSRFDPHRMHPILKTPRPHLGVDLASPRGTPVKAASSGQVYFAGRKGGYGNLVILDNGNHITTRYAHLQRFAKGIKKGVTVHRGQTIAYVGSTGLATGPHLHYEYRKNGKALNPMTVKLPRARAIPSAYTKDFKDQALKMIAELDQIPSAHTIMVATDKNKTNS